MIRTRRCRRVKNATQTLWRYSASIANRGSVSLWAGKSRRSSSSQRPLASSKSIPCFSLFLALLLGSYPKSTRYVFYTAAIGFTQRACVKRYAAELMLTAKKSGMVKKWLVLFSPILFGSDLAKTRSPTAIPPKRGGETADTDSMPPRTTRRHRGASARPGHLKLPQAILSAVPTSRRRAAAACTKALPALRLLGRSLSCHPRRS